MKRGQGESKLVCGEHNTRLQSKIDTDGEGGYIERVSPCPNCRSRISFVVRQPDGTAAAPAEPKPKQRRQRESRGPKGNRHCTKKNDAGEYVCIICDTPLDFKPSGKSGGRIPVFCDHHKNPKNRPSS